MTDMSKKKASPRISSFEHAQMLGHECWCMGSVGKLEFKAPEVVENKPYGFKADSWSFGIVVFHMLTNQYPYSKESSIEE